MKCKNCNMDIHGGMNVCPHCGCYLNGNTIQNDFSDSMVVTGDKVNVGFAILSWFIPLAGLIIFLVKKDSSPKTSKVCGLCALISFLLNLFVVIMAFSFVFINVKRDIDDMKIDPGVFEQEDVIEQDYFNDNMPTINGSANWKDYQVVIKNQVVTLPVAYNDLATVSGLTVKESAAKSYLNNGYYTFLNMYNNDKLALYIEVLNDTGSRKLYTDCKVTRITQSKYQVSQGAPVVVFPGNLKVGDSVTESQIISLFGTPNDIDDYTSGTYSSKKYSFVADTTWTTTNYYKITVVNGVIDELALDNRN